METDYLLLHARIDRLIHLGRQHGATDDELRRALEGPNHPDRVNLPAAGRLPAIDPAPYLEHLTTDARLRHNLPGPEYAKQLCGAHITEAESELLRESPSGWEGITTCILPANHTPGPGAHYHQGILIRADMDPAWPTLWQWQGPVRELGQVARA
jgi:hypothetical protein